MAETRSAPLERLERILEEMGSAVIAYSGGVDSALLAVTAQRVLGARALAVTAVSPALAQRELAEAKSIAQHFGLNHRVIETNEMAQPGYVSNAPNRCYFCKTELYTRLCRLAQEEAFAWVANGSNTDDLGDYRPGLQAASERQVRSPLVEAGLSKALVRELARELNIPIWDKPAQPCLSSRIPYGTPVTLETLSKIEKAEDCLRSLGLREVRARHHDKLCRIEVGESEMEAAFARRKEITAALKKIGYLWVSLDMTGLRSGSLNDAIRKPAPAPQPWGV